MNIDGERPSDRVWVPILLLTMSGCLAAATYLSITAPLWIKLLILVTTAYVGVKTHRMLEADMERMRRNIRWMERQVERELTEMDKHNDDPTEGK